MDSYQIFHPTYKVVDESEADAITWVFVDRENMKRLPIKLPELKPNEVRAKVTYTGLCQGDCQTVKEKLGPCAHPIVPGHEIVGIVTQVGSEVKNLKVGDKVGFGAQRECCEECEYCKSDHENLCRGKIEQGRTYGAKYWGGYASHIQQPASFFFKVPENLPEDKIPLFCAGITTYSPISRYAKPGQEVAVLGVGGLGHLAVQFAKAWGCRVTGFTSSPDKEKSILELGAERVVVASPETLQADAGKYHLVLNFLPEGENFNVYVSLTKPLGTFCQIGAPPLNKPCIINPFVLICNQINLVGSHIGSRKEIKEMLEFCGKHKIVPMCEQFDFKNFPKAYDRLLNGKPHFRCVVDATKVHAHH